MGGFYGSRWGYGVPSGTMIWSSGLPVFPLFRPIRPSGLPGSNVAHQDLRQWLCRT